MTLSECLAKYKILPGCHSHVGDGWVPLVDDVLSRVEAAKTSITVDQIKEKMGGLRFYVSECEDWVQEAASEAERKSWKVCELCGNPGEVRKGGWWKTLCDACEASR